MEVLMAEVVLVRTGTTIKLRFDDALFNYFRVEFHDSATSSGFHDIFGGMTLSEPLNYRRHSLN